MRRRFINPAYALTSFLLLCAGVMLIVAIVLPEWSHASNLASIGLWQVCQRLTQKDWTCSNVPSPESDDGFFIAARVFTISAVVVAFCGCCFAWSAIIRPHKRFAGVLLICTCVAAFVLSVLAWGMWIGFHGRYVHQLPDPSFTSSFILTCTASALALLCVPVAALGLKLNKHPGKVQCPLSRHAPCHGAAQCPGMYADHVQCPSDDDVKLPPNPAPSPSLTPRQP